MEPSTILISLLCLALLVYLPKLRNVVLWLCFPWVMVLVRFPRTRTPALALALLGGVIYGVHAWHDSIVSPAAPASLPPGFVPDPSSIQLPPTPFKYTLGGNPGMVYKTASGGGYVFIPDNGQPSQAITFK